VKDRTVTFEDPDFGAIEVPESKFPTREEWQDRIGRYREAIKGQRIWPAGSVSECPQCRKSALVGSNELVHRVVRPGNVQTFRNLRGAKCSACGSQFFEPEETIAVEDAVGVGVMADFEAKVSNIGSGTLGTYWPKDVVRVMDLEPGRPAFIQILDKDTALVRFTGPRKARTSTRRAKRTSRR
jgi:YgiT-type zinc finger domain-containing protein